MAGKSLINEILDGVEKTSISDGFYMANVWLQKGGPPNFMGRKSMSIHGVLQGMILAAEARVWGAQLVSSNLI